MSETTWYKTDNVAKVFLASHNRRDTRTMRESVTLTVFKIDGANYFKLRDLGRALDFHVGYDNETKTVCISGAHGYAAEP